MKKIIVAIGLSLVSFGSLFSQTKIYNLPLNIGTTWDWLPTTQGLNTVKINPSSLWLGIPFAIKDEGINVVGSGATSINFTGAGVTTTQVSNAVTVNIPSSGGGGGGTWGTITGTLSTQTDLNNALSTKQGNITLTTTGTSGAATKIGDVINIPQYSGVVAVANPTIAATTGTILLQFSSAKDFKPFTITGNIALDTAATGNVASQTKLIINGNGVNTLAFNASWNNINSGVFNVSTKNYIYLYRDANGNVDYTIHNGVASAITQHRSIDLNSETNVLKTASQPVNLSFSPNQPFTISVWLKYGTITASVKTLLELKSSAGDHRIRVQFATTGHIYFIVGTDASRVGTNGFNGNFNTWNHHVFTWDGTNSVTSLKAYLNNVETTNGGSSTSFTTLPTSATDILYIGSESTGANRLNSLIDELVFINKVLTPAEMTAIYNAGKVIDYASIPSIVSNIRAYYRFNTTVTDNGTFLYNLNGIPSPIYSIDQP